MENAAQARPTIRVHPAEGGSDQFSHSTSLSHSSDDESSRGSFDLDDVFPDPRNNAAKLARLTVTCTLHITLASKKLPGPDPELVLAINDPNSYTKIENTCRNFVRERCQEDLVGKDLFLRYGTCTIVGQKDGVSLTSQEDWATVCTIITNLLISEPTRALHLDIQGECFAFRPRASSDISFAVAKRNEIHTLLKPAAGGKMYISRTDLLRVTSRDTIRDIIIQDSRIPVNEKDSLIAQVPERARKLFAMFVYARLSMSCLKTLLDRGCTDDSLPLTTASDCHLGNPQCTVEFSNLSKDQGSFMAAEFMVPGQHQKFHSKIVVPIRFWLTDKKKGDPKRKHTRNVSEDAESSYGGDDPEKRSAWCGAGAYSNVYRVRMDPSHHRLTENKDVDFALKEFKDRPKYVRADFNQELRILNELRALPQKHMVTHLATWLQDGRYCMLFPYAECNLSQYMESTPFGTPTRERILWLLRQLRGLAQALKDIHNLSVAETSPSGSNLGPQHVGTRKAGYHHDLKPKNILSFPKPNSTYSTFKVADFGSGKINTYRSGSVNTRSPTGTPTYAPPEVNMDEGRISRPYDLWSLGCVFLELLIWAAFGYQEVTDFENARFARRCPNSTTELTEDDGFWQMDEDGSVTLRTPVHTYIQRLREDFLRDDVPRQRHQSFKAVLELVIRMLEPDRLKRTDALQVWNTLDNIYKQMRVDFGKVADLANNSVSESHESQQPDAQPVRLSMEPPRSFAPDQSEDDISPTAISVHRNNVAHLAVDTSTEYPQRRYSSTSVTPASAATSTQCLPGSMQGSMHGSMLEYSEKGDTKPEDEDDDVESVEETRR